VTAPAVLPHITALQAALTAANLTAYDGGAPPATALPPTYVVIYPDPGRASASSMADDRTVLDIVVQLTCVATTAAGATGTADRVRAALVAPLTVAGRVLWRAEELGGPPRERDDELVPPLWFLPVQYRLRSIPA
jgi:hypothetical protein